MAAKSKRIEAETHITRIVRVPARVRPVAAVKAVPVKRTFSRCDLPGGDFLMNYYYVLNAKGDFVPEDIERATHCERIVFDRDGNPIGSTMTRLGDKVRW